MNPLTRYDPFTRGFDDAFKGMFLRPVRFDVDIDESKVDAKYTDGVLKLKLPKKAASASYWVCCLCQALARRCRVPSAAVRFMKTIAWCAIRAGCIRG